MSRRAGPDAKLETAPRDLLSLPQQIGKLIAGIFGDQLAPIAIYALDDQVLWSNGPYDHLVKTAIDQSSIFDMLHPSRWLDHKRLQAEGHVWRDGAIDLGGKDYLLKAHFTPLLDDGGLLIGIASTLEMTPNLAKMSRDLGRMQERLNDVIRLASDWVWETDPSLNMTFLSDRVAKIMGYYPVELLGKPLQGLAVNRRAMTTVLKRFETLTQTIERQTDHIKSMVDEFASFARMPQPVMADQDLRLAVQEPAVLFREGHKDVDFKLSIPDSPVRARFDLRLVSQAVTNLIKNAAEAIESYGEPQGRPAGYKGEIEVRVLPANDRVAIEVIDNGIGLPKQNRAKLLEPYVTTRAKGTGLGLAIVQKVVEQHSGALTLEDAPHTETRKRGALIRMTLPIKLEIGHDLSTEQLHTASHATSGA